MCTGASKLCVVFVALSLSAAAHRANDQPVDAIAGRRYLKPAPPQKAFTPQRNRNALRPDDRKLVENLDFFMSFELFEHYDLLGDPVE